MNVFLCRCHHSIRLIELYLSLTDSVEWGWKKALISDKRTRAGCLSPNKDFMAGDSSCWHNLEAHPDTALVPKPPNRPLILRCMASLFTKHRHGDPPEPLQLGSLGITNDVMLGEICRHSVERWQSIMEWEEVRRAEQEKAERSMAVWVR